MKRDTVTENLPFAQELASLPIFAQTLIACRVIRRAVLASIDGDDGSTAQCVCEAIESVAENGREAACDDPALNSIAGIRTTSKNESVVSALHLVVDAVKLAHRGTGDSCAEGVAALVNQSIKTVWTDRHFTALQVAIIIKGDIDQIRFACSEANIRLDQGVSRYVLGRLTPCHAFSVFEPRRPIEEDYR